MQIQTIDIKDVVKSLDDYNLRRLIKNSKDQERLLDSFILKAIDEFGIFTVSNCDHSFKNRKEFGWYFDNNEAMEILYRQLTPVIRLGNYPDVYYKRIKGVIFLVFLN